MTIENLALLKATGAKMKYLNVRQQVIAQNIANADTSGYVARDVSELDFGNMLSRISGENKLRSPSGMTSSDVRGGDVEMQRATYEVTPSGNAVNIEEQLVKSNEVQMDYNMMLNIMRKQVGMLRTAIGRNNQ